MARATSIISIVIRIGSFGVLVGGVEVFWSGGFDLGDRFSFSTSCGFLLSIEAICRDQ